MGMTNYFKIGKTTNITRRLQNLKTGNPFELHLIYLFDGDVERQLHKKFKRNKIRGEFYQLTKEQVKKLKGKGELYNACYQESRGKLSSRNVGM
jgi:hypothetical protein